MAQKKRDKIGTPGIWLPSVRAAAAVDGGRKERATVWGAGEAGVTLLFLCFSSVWRFARDGFVT